MKLVKTFKGTPCTSSRDIASTFGKKHYNVLRDLKELIQDGDLEVASILSAPYSVIQSTYTDKSNRTAPEYLLDRDACTLLVMGYKGTTARKFKISYINEFNRMRDALDGTDYETEYVSVLDTLGLIDEDDGRPMNPKYL